MTDSLEILISRYLDGECSESETEHISRRIAEDPSFAKKYYSHVKVSSMMYLISRKPEVLSVSSAGIRVSRFRFRAVLLAAASLIFLLSLAALVTVIFLSSETSEAEIAEFGGKVFLDRKGNLEPVGTDTFLKTGDTIRTAEGGMILIRYPEDETTLLISEKTGLTLEDENGAKRITVYRGRIFFDVAKQKPGKNMQVSSPHAVAEVIGTRFTFTVDTELTSISVKEGLVRFTRLKDNFSVEVPAGSAADSVIPGKKTDREEPVSPGGPVSYTEHYPDGKIKIEGRKENGKRVGLWNTYYETGVLRSRGSFIDDKPDGQWEEWYPDGTLKISRIWKEGKVVGRFSVYFPSGEIWMTSSYDSYSRRDGRTTWYTDSGIIVREGSFFDDYRIGVWTFRDAEGRLLKGYIEQKWDSGEKEFQGRFKNGHPDGPWKRWFDNGNPESEGTYADGKETGLWKYYYKQTHTLYKQGNYDENGMTGEWTFYFRDDVQMAAGSYRNGLRDGVWRFYFPDGPVRFEGSYREGKLTGTWTLFSSAGVKEDEHTFPDEGVLQTGDPMFEKKLQRIYK